jgi:hypothetical protein
VPACWFYGRPAGLHVSVGWWHAASMCKHCRQDLGASCPLPWDAGGHCNACLHQQPTVVLLLRRKRLVQPCSMSASGADRARRGRRRVVVHRPRRALWASLGCRGEGGRRRARPPGAEEGGRRRAGPPGEEAEGGTGRPGVAGRRRAGPLEEEGGASRRESPPEEGEGGYS